MLYPRIEKGFTLIEVSLAIVIGLVVLAGAVAIYNQARESAATGRMNEKVLAAATVIEEINAQIGSFPNPTVPEDQNRVQLKFQKARADDYNMSPWGGPVGPDARPYGIMPFWMQPYLTLPVIGGPTQLAADGTQNLSGGVQYFALGTGTTMVPTATASYFDKTRQAYVTYRGYVISGVNQKNEDGWIAYGPKP